MTSRFILDVFNLDLSSPRFFIRLGLLVVVVVLSTTLNRVMVSDERIIANSRWSRGWNGMSIYWRGIPHMVKRSLAFPHGGRCRRQVGLLNVEHET